MTEAQIALKDTFQTTITAYAAIGYRMHPKFEGIYEAMSNEGMGEVEQIKAVTELTDDLWQMLEDEDSYGVFEYDVAEPLGTWIADWVSHHREFPTKEQTKARAQELAKGFSE